MLDVLKPIAIQLELNGRQLLNAIQDMSAEVWLGRLGERSNHPAFLALHLLDARCFLLGLLGAPASHGFEDVGKDATRLEDIPVYPDSAEIAEAWRRVGKDLPAVLEAVGNEQLAAKAPHDFPVGDSTVLGAIAFLAQHEAYHLGQLVLIRRAGGMAPLSYS